MKLRLDAAVAMPSDPRVQLERRPQGEPVLDDRAVRADEEGKRPKQPGRNARERPSLANRFPRAADVARSQRAQTPVHGLLMVERRAAAEVVGFDQRDAEAAARGVVRARQPVDAPADDQQIVGAGLEPCQIAGSHVIRSAGLL